MSGWLKGTNGLFTRTGGIVAVPEGADPADCGCCNTGTIPNACNQSALTISFSGVESILFDSEPTIWYTGGGVPICYYNFHNINSSYLLSFDASGDTYCRFKYTSGAIYTIDWEYFDEYECVCIADTASSSITIYATLYTSGPYAGSIYIIAEVDYGPGGGESTYYYYEDYPAGGIVKGVPFANTNTRHGATGTDNFGSCTDCPSGDVDVSYWGDIYDGINGTATITW